MRVDVRDLSAIGLDVSRETVDRLHALADLVERWNPAINLVSRRSLPEIWHRHVLDSAQLWRLRPPELTNWCDLGSGGGFPGLVIAALAAGAGNNVHLVESDTRKCAFLATAARTLGLPATVHATRIEAAAVPPPDVVSARALAPLRTLVGYAKTLLPPGGIALFPKGETVHKELAEAARYWSFAHCLHPSLTDPRSAIVEIGAIHGPQTSDPCAGEPERGGRQDHDGDQPRHRARRSR